MPNFNILLLALVVRYAKASAEPVLLIHGRSDLFFFLFSALHKHSFLFVNPYFCLIQVVLLKSIVAFVMWARHHVCITVITFCWPTVL